MIERTDLEEMVAAVDVSDQPAGPDLATTIHELAGVVTSAFIRARKFGLTSGASQPHLSPSRTSHRARLLLTPAWTTTNVTARAARGSAHHPPTSALAARPSRTASDGKRTVRSAGPAGRWQLLARRGHLPRPVDG